MLFLYAPNGRLYSTECMALYKASPVAATTHRRFRVLVVVTSSWATGFMSKLSQLDIMLFASFMYVYTPVCARGPSEVVLPLQLFHDRTVDICNTHCT